MIVFCKKKQISKQTETQRKRGASTTTQHQTTAGFPGSQKQISAETPFKPICRPDVACDNQHKKQAYLYFPSQKTKEKVVVNLQHEDKKKGREREIEQHRAVVSCR